MASKSSDSTKVSTDPAKITELLTRGVAEVYPSREALETALKSGKRLRVYNGIDPTADTLHIGHLASLQKLRQFQELGHEAIMLIGDFTGMIGDPTGKSATRKQLTREQVDRNAKRYQDHASSVLVFAGKSATKIRRNSEWWDEMSTLNFLELLSLTTVQRLIERDMFEQRIDRLFVQCKNCNFLVKLPITITEAAFATLSFERNGVQCSRCREVHDYNKNDLLSFREHKADHRPIAAHEFLYPALQGYDSAAMTVDVEVGGTDQTFNMLMGREFVKKLQGREKFVITVPLLADASGKKIGKTEGNMVELGATPEDLFGQAMALPDGVIVACFEQCTAVLMAKIEEVRKRLTKGENPRDLKMELATEFVRMRYGETEAPKAHAAFVRTFQKHEVPEAVSRKAVSHERLPIVDLLVEVGFANSKSEARRVVQQKGVKIDGRIVDDPDAVIEIPKDGILIQKGKRHFVRVVSR